MKLTKTILATIIALPLAFGSVSAFAGGKMKGLDGVILTAEQQTQLQTMKQEFHTLHQQQKQQGRELKAQFKQRKHAIVFADSFDEAAARKLAEDMAKVKVEHQVQQMKEQQKMYSILTPEQKAQVEQNIQNKMMQKQNKRGGCQGQASCANPQ